MFYAASPRHRDHSPSSSPTPGDSVLAGYALCLAAQAMGLGSCLVPSLQNAINPSVACKRRLIGLTRHDNVYAV